MIDTNSLRKTQENVTFAIQPLKNLMLCAPFRIIGNAKLIGQKLQEATRNHPLIQRRYNQIHMEFRTMDKDINTLRPQLMKLVWEKEQYIR